MISEYDIERIRDYDYASPELIKNLIFNLLDYLQDEYSVISYKKTFKIKLSDGNYKTANDKEASMIRRIQAEILCKNNTDMQEVHSNKKKEDEFYKNVVDEINKIQNDNVKWINYHDIVEMVI